MEKEKFRFTLMGRVEIKKYSIEHEIRHRHPRSYVTPYITEEFRVKEHLEIVKERDLVLAVLKAGDKLFVNEINKAVKILEAYPTTDGRYIYFTDYVIKRIEDGEEVEKSWIEAERIVEKEENLLKEYDVYTEKRNTNKIKGFFSKLFKK